MAQHTLLPSIVNAVDDLKLQAENLENLPGVGLKGTVKENYSIVSYAYLKENDITIDEEEVQKVLIKA